MAEKEATLLLKIKEAGAAILDKFVFTLGDVVNIAKSVGAAIADTINEFRKQEEAINALNQTMVNNGMFTAELRNRYLEYASALQQTTTFADEEAIAATAVLQTYLKQIPVTEELLKATSDLATAKKMDLASAAELVGKTIGTETNALARSGIEVDKNATAQKKLSQVVEELNGKWKGQAEAQAKGLGSLKQLGNAFGEIKESIGGSLAPLLGFIAMRLTEMANAVNLNAGPALGFIADLFIAAAKFGYQLSASVYNIGINIASLASVAAEVLKGNFTVAKELFKSNSDEIAKIREEQNAKLQELDNMQTKNRLVQIQAGHEADLALQMESDLKKAELKTESEDEAFNTMATRRQEEAMYLNDLRVQELASTGMFQDNLLRMKIGNLDKLIAAESNAAKKRQLNIQKDQLIEKLGEEEMAKAKLALQQETFGKIASLSRSSNSTLAAIGKAAAITQIAIETPVAVSRALAAFPPPFNFVAAGLVGAAMAVQAAQIAGVPLAEGGIVKARPGGIQATIGEGGQDEAVIPLGDSGLQMGTQITIYNYGGMLGDEASAHQFAIALDKELLKLRRNNESVAFDQRVI